MSEAEDRLRLFKKGDAIEVPFTKVESELRALWRHAAEGKPGEPRRPVTRACLWNLIVAVDTQALVEMKALTDHVGRQFPARTILVGPIETHPGEDEGEIYSFVQAHWRAGEAHATGSEQVTLLSTGAAATRLPSLVRSLLVPDAPTAMLWLDTPTHESAVRELTFEVDRLIIDSRSLEREADLDQYDLLSVHSPSLEFADLAWIGISPMRSLAAALFDPPHDPAQLDQLTRVRVTSGIAGTQARALLMLGWLADRLGWHNLRRQKGSAIARRWTATRRHGGEVQVELQTELGGASHGVTGLLLEKESDRWSLRRDTGAIDVTAPGLPMRSQPARSHTNAELVVAALGARGRDPSYREGLRKAIEFLQAHS